MNPIYRDMPTTIFEEMSQAARDHGAINLGQGFPDAPGPRDIRQAAADALIHGSNQYPPMMGTADLRSTVADHYRRHQALPVTPEQILVTSGATEALAATLLAIVEAGDEVILLQPAYDAYLPLVRRAGGVAVLVTLRPPAWRLPIAAIAAAIGPRTRAIILNTPMNPTARMFDAGELAGLADLCITHNLIAICDEVWEHVRFDGRDHVPLIGLPGMADRTIKIGSAGKIFALTGWKVGFVIAAPPLLAPIARAHQFLTFTTPPNLQAAVAYGMAKEEGWFAAMREGLQRSRDRLAAALAGEGFAVLPAEGTYFLCVDLPGSGIMMDDRAVCAALVRDAGVAAIPLSALYAQDAVTSVIRLCFAKEDATLDEAARRLGRWRAAVVGR